MEYILEHCKNDGTSNAHCNRYYLSRLRTYVHIIIIKIASTTRLGRFLLQLNLPLANEIPCGTKYTYGERNSLRERYCKFHFAMSQSDIISLHCLQCYFAILRSKIISLKGITKNTGDGGVYYVASQRDMTTLRTVAICLNCV